MEGGKGCEGWREGRGVRDGGRVGVWGMEGG